MIRGQEQQNNNTRINRPNRWEEAQLTENLIRIYNLKQKMDHKKDMINSKSKLTLIDTGNN